LATNEENRRHPSFQPGAAVVLPRTDFSASFSEKDLREVRGSMGSGKISYEEMEEKVRLLEERIASLIRHDPVTGLHNKKAFLERLEEGLVHAGRYGNTKSILLIRLDGLEAVESGFGGGIAEKVMKRTARKLMGLLRESDYLARWGKRDFAVILGNPREATPDTVRRKILESLSPPLNIDGNRVGSLFPAVGIAIFPDDGECTETLLRHAADAATALDP
jgi:diguanylate cyclase (GGDEF)-like protein